MIICLHCKISKPAEWHFCTFIVLRAICCKSNHIVSYCTAMSYHFVSNQTLKFLSILYCNNLYQTVSIQMVRYDIGLCWILVRIVSYYLFVRIWNDTYSYHFISCHYRIVLDHVLYRMVLYQTVQYHIMTCNELHCTESYLLGVKWFTKVMIWFGPQVWGQGPVQVWFIYLKKPSSPKLVLIDIP